MRFVSVVGSSIGFYLPLAVMPSFAKPLAITGTPATVPGGALVFGLGFGVLQNATLVLMYSRAPSGGEGLVSAIWNGTYDLGMTAGALGAGLLVAAVGYPIIFILTAALMLPALIVVRRDHPGRQVQISDQGER